jgi:hypothetical protein
MRGNRERCIWLSMCDSRRETKMAVEVEEERDSEEGVDLDREIQIQQM